MTNRIFLVVASFLACTTLKAAEVGTIVAGKTLDDISNGAEFRVNIVDASLSTAPILQKASSKTPVSLTLDISLPASQNLSAIDVYVLIRLNQTLFMLSEQNGITTWNGSVEALEPFKTSLLTADGEASLSIYSGEIDITGELSFFVAYSTGDLASLVYTDEPTLFTVFSSSNFQLQALDWTLTEEEHFVDTPAFILDSPAVDIDNDGYTDIVFSGPLYNASGEGWIDVPVPIRWLRNTGGSGFELGDETVFPESSRLSHFHHWRIADFNHDGFDDIMATNSGLDAPPWPGERNLLLMNSGNGSFEDVSVGKTDTFDFQGMTHSLAIGDINGDSRIDIVTGDAVTNNHPNDGRELLDQNIRININQGNAEFTRDISALDIDGEKTSITDIALVDLDNDADLDMVFGSSCDESEVAMIYWNDGAGYFNSVAPTELPNFYLNDVLLSNALAIAGINLNGDEFLDLVIARNKCYQENDVQFLLNNGDRTFSDVSAQYKPEGDIATGFGTASPNYLQVHDFNLDGIDDIMLGYNGGRLEEDSHIWLGSEAGRFVNFESPDLNSHPYLLQSHSWVLDVDNDGDLDWVQRGRKVLERFEGSDYVESEEKMTWRILQNLVIP